METNSGGRGKKAVNLTAKRVRAVKAKRRQSEKNPQQRGYADERIFR